MKKGQIIEGVVTRVDFPNKGIVLTDEGDKLTVKNVIEGQRVMCAVKKARKDKAQGLFREVVARSPFEMEKSACIHSEDCGGCAYQRVDYDTQLKFKDAQIRRIFQDVIPGFEDLFEGVIPSPIQTEYRNKMEFSFGDAVIDGPLELGMHKRGSFYDIVTVKDCQIIDEDMRNVLIETLKYFSERNISYFHKMRHEGYLRHLLVRKAVKTEEMIVDLVTSSNLIGADEAELLKGWQEALLNIDYTGKLVGILHTTNDRDGDVVEDQGTDVLFGQAYFYEELLGLKFKITPFSFFQTNSLGAEVLYSKAREYISDSLDGNLDKLNGKVLYDLYSGTGTIAQIMAPVADKVIGVEIIEEAVEAAKINASENGLDNCEFIAGDVLKVIDGIETKPDYIILDPPRDGINPKALKKIIDYGVDNMVYISCKPTSLARDLEMLQESGYEVKKISCVDMFPGTVHVETVVQLSKGDIDRDSSERKSIAKTDDIGMISGYNKGNKAPETTNVKIDFSLENLDLSELRGKATYEQIKDYVSEQTGFRVSTLYISQVKRKCGLEVGESYNKPKSEDAKQPQCTPEKEAAIMQALRHYGMI